MSTFLNDQEQVDLLKSLWKKYGNLLLVMIAIVAIGIAGWRLWHNRHVALVASASAAYQNVLNTLASKTPNTKVVQAQAHHVMQDYSQTGYAPLAAMLLASEEVKLGQFASAERNLKWAISHTNNQHYQAIATLRLARIDINQGKAQEAIALLNNPPQGFLASYYAVQGQAHRALKQYASAHADFTRALSQLTQDDPYRQIVLTLMSELPATTPQHLLRKH